MGVYNTDSCPMLPGMFDATKGIGEQRCTPPGYQLGVKLEMDVNGRVQVMSESGQPSDSEELEIMLKGGHRNKITQPVSAYGYADNKILRI